MLENLKERLSRAEKTWFTLAAGRVCTLDGLVPWLSVNRHSRIVLEHSCSLTPTD